MAGKSFDVSIFVHLKEAVTGPARKVVQEFRNMERNIKASSTSMAASTRRAQTGFMSLGASATSATAKVSRLAHAMRNLRTVSMSAGFGGGMGTMLAFPLFGMIKRFGDYESKLIDIRKVWLGTEQDYGRLVAKLKELNGQIPLTRAEIATLMEEGVRSGIGLKSPDPVKELSEFTRIAAQFAVAFRLPSVETAATKLAKLQSQLSLTSAEFVALGDTMNTLAGTSATNETELLEFINRVGGLAKSVGGMQGLMDAITIGSSQMAAGTLKEVAATGFRTFLARMSTQPADSKKAMKTLGLDRDEVKKRLTKDLYGTTLDVFKRIAKAPEHLRAGILAQLAGLKSFDAFVRLLANMELLEQQRATVTGKERLTMQAEFERRLTSLNSMAQITANVLSDLSDSLVAKWRPQIAWLLTSLQQLGKNLNGNSWLVWGAGLMAATAAISLLLIPLGMLGISLYSAYLVATALRTGLAYLFRGGIYAAGFLAFLKDALAAMGRAVAMTYSLSGALGVAGLAFLALWRMAKIGLFVEALIQIYRHWERIKLAFTDPLKLTIVWPEMPAWLKSLLEIVAEQNKASTPGEDSWLRGKLGSAAEWLGLGPAKPQVATPDVPIALPEIVVPLKDEDGLPVRNPRRIVPNPARNPMRGINESLIPEAVGKKIAADGAAGGVAGITVQANGPNVTFRQAPPNISISTSVTVNATTNASPNEIGAAVASQVSGKVRGALSDASVVAP